MLVLTFQVEQILYAIPVSQVIEVIPRVGLRPVPHAPRALLGLLHYRGAAIPVVDLGLLLGGAKCGDRLDTRIILVRSTSEAARDDRLGLVAEQVNILVDVDFGHAAMAQPQIKHAPYLGAVYETKHGLLQLIDPRHITVAAGPEPRGAIAP